MDEGSPQKEREDYVVADGSGQLLLGDGTRRTGRPRAAILMEHVRSRVVQYGG